jgi:hypothetical protein
MDLITELFTRRFVKDILLISLIGSSLYVLINNPIVSPKPKQIKGLWSIELMQHPLIFGIAGHNYLVLRNENNDIIKELHGLATDSATGAWKYVGNKESDRLKVWEFNSPRYYLAQKNYAGITLKQGSRELETSVWRKAEPCKDDINKKNLPYPPYGVNIRGDTENSNSVAYTLIQCMGLDARHIGLITPGWKKNLLTQAGE